MSATYDPATGRIILEGEGTGWNRAKVALPSAPSGCNQAIYVFRHWIDSVASNAEFIDNSLLWASTQHFGFSFSSTHPSKPSSTGSTGETDAKANYTDLLGVGTWGQQPPAQSSGGYSAEDTDTGVKRDYCLASKFDGGGLLKYLVSTGNGDNLAVLTGGNTTQDKANGEMPYTFPRNQATGLATTYVFRVYSSQLDEEVILESWVNTDSIDLDSLNLGSPDDLDPNNPKSSIPVSNFWTDTYSLNGGATTGTNWRPSSGVMAFPSHFLTQYPMASKKLVLDYLGVQYSKVTS